MDKKLFDDAIGELPPSTVDIEAAIARGRRSARFPLLGSPVAAVIGGVLVLTMGIAMALMPGKPDGDTLTGPPSRTTPPPGTAAWYGCDNDDYPPTEPDDIARANRLGAALSAAVTRRLPPTSRLTKVVRDDRGPTAFRVEAPSSGERSCEVDPDAMHSMAGVAWMGSDNTRLTASITSGEFAGGASRERWCANPPDVPYHARCDRRTTPGGDKILEVVATRGELVVANGVEVARADGTAVSLLVDAGMLADGDPYTPPLTIDQLVEIALDPALAIDP